MNDEETNQALPENQFAQLMNEIRESHTQFEDKLSAFNNEMRQGQGEAAVQALKRARHKKPYQYRRKGSEKQASFNVRVDKVLAKVQLDLPGPSTLPALEQRC